VPVPTEQIRQSLTQLQHASPTTTTPGGAGRLGTVAAAIAAFFDALIHGVQQAGGDPHPFVEYRKIIMETVRLGRGRSETAQGYRREATQKLSSLLLTLQEFGLVHIDAHATTLAQEAVATYLAQPLGPAPERPQPNTVDDSGGWPSISASMPELHVTFGGFSTSPPTTAAPDLPPPAGSGPYATDYFDRIENAHAADIAFRDAIPPYDDVGAPRMFNPQHDPFSREYYTQRYTGLNQRAVRPNDPLYAMIDITVNGMDGTVVLSALTAEEMLRYFADLVAKRHTSDTQLNANLALVDLSLEKLQALATPEALLDGTTLDIEGDPLPDGQSRVYDDWETELARWQRARDTLDRIRQQARDNPEQAANLLAHNDDPYVQMLRSAEQNRDIRPLLPPQGLVPMNLDLSVWEQEWDDYRQQYPKEAADALLDLVGTPYEHDAGALIMYNLARIRAQGSEYAHARPPNIARGLRVHYFEEQWRDFYTRQPDDAEAVIEALEGSPYASPSGGGIIASRVPTDLDGRRDPAAMVATARQQVASARLLTPVIEMGRQLADLGYDTANFTLAQVLWSYSIVLTR